MQGAVEKLCEPAGGVDAAPVVSSPGVQHAEQARACRNCSAPVWSHYCAACGQKVHLHRSIGEAAHEMVHGILHFDTKLWRTLPLLATRPGFLTRDYIEGRRARYISPVALFLMTIFVTYIVLTSVRPPIPEDAVMVDGDIPWAQGQAPAGLGAARAELARELADARADPARAAEVARLERIAKALAALPVEPSAEPGTRAKGDLASAVRESRLRGDLRIDIFGNDELEASANAALENPDLVLYKMQQKGYKLSFLLVPMLLPWL